MGELGYVFDYQAPKLFELLGYEEGVIYIPSYAYIDSSPRATLVETIQHEFGHCWAWLEPKLFRSKDYKNAFKESYWNDWKFGHQLYQLFKNKENEFRNSEYFDHYATVYSLFSPAEDFCETFMIYLKCRGKISKYNKRKGLYKKLQHIKKMIRVVSRR